MQIEPFRHDLLLRIAGSLEPKLESGQPLHEIGRGIHDFSFHDGGAVFRTEDEVVAFMIANKIAEGRSVYGVLAEWDADTIQLSNEPHRRLVKSSLIVRLPYESDSGESPKSVVPPRSDGRGGGAEYVPDGDIV